MSWRVFAFGLHYLDLNIDRRKVNDTTEKAASDMRSHWATVSPLVVTMWSRLSGGGVISLEHDVVYSAPTYMYICTIANKSKNIPENLMKPINRRGFCR